MIKRCLAVGFLALAMTVTGCASRTPMPFQKDTDRITETTKPVYLMSVTMKNTYHTSFQPRIITLHVEKSGAKDSADRLNFVMDDKAKLSEKDSEQDGNTYLLRLELDPGTYEIVGITGMARSFPIIGLFFAPIHSTLDSKAPGVYYLGHVAATVRERKGKEFKAGSTIPLIDQAIAGASGGTFDVEITDDFATDEAVFRSRFPALADVAIAKSVMPPFDRDKAQAWWEEH